MQNELLTLNRFYHLFPNAQKGCQLVCQTTLHVNGRLYRDYLLDLANDQKHRPLVENFVSEVSKGLVKSNDVNWFNRFKGIKGVEKTIVKQPLKKQIVSKLQKTPIVKKDKVVEPVQVLKGSDDDIDDKFSSGEESGDMSL